MDFKNEICATFKTLRSAERIDLLCGLFHLCVPLELRFIGSCLEDLIRRNHLTQIDFEGKANDDTFNGDIKLNVLSRDLFHEISLYMSFLHSDNTNSARAYFRVLEHIKCSIDFQIDQLEPPTFQFDNCVIADIELMYTMAIHHPAFSYEERIKLYKYLKQLQLTFKEMKSSQKLEEEKSDEDVGSTSSSLSSVKSEVTSKEEMIVGQGQQDSNDIQTLLLNNDKISDEDSSLPNNAIKHQTESPQGLLTEIRLKDISVKRCVPKYECCIEAVLSDGSVINITKSYSDIKSYFNSIFGNKYSKANKSEINGLNFPLENVENVEVLQNEMNLYFRKLLPQVQNPAMTSAMLGYFFKTKIGVEDSLTVQMLTSCPSKRDGTNVQNCNTEPSTDDSSHAGNKSHLQSFTVYNSQLSSSAQRKFRLGRHRAVKEPNSPTASGSTNRHVPPLRGQGDPAGTSSVRACVSPSVASPCISNSTAASLNSCNSSCCSSRSDSPASAFGQPMLANGSLIKTNNLTNCKYIEDRKNKDAKMPLVHNLPDQNGSLIMNSQHSALLPYSAATRPLCWHIAQTVQPEFIETKGSLGPLSVDPNIMMEPKKMVDGRGEIGVHSEVSMLPLIGHIPDCILPQQPPTLPYYQQFNLPPSTDQSVRKSGIDVATEAFPSANSIPARHSPPAVQDNSAVLPSHKNVRPILGSNSNHAISCKSKPVKSTSAPPLPAVTSQNVFSVNRSPPMPVSSNPDIVPQLVHAPRPASLNVPSNPQAANSLKTRSFAAVAANRRDSPGPPLPPPPSISAGFPPLSQVFPVKLEKNFPVRPPSNVPTPLPSPSNTPPVPQSNGSGSAAGTPCATSCNCMQCAIGNQLNQFPIYGPGPSHFYYSLPYGYPLNANGFIASPHNFAVQPPSVPSQVPVRFAPRFLCSPDFIVNISNGFPPGFQQQFGQPPFVPNQMMFPAGAPFSRPMFNPSIPPPNFVQGQQPQSVAATRPPLKPIRRTCCANCGSNDHRVESCPDSLMVPPGPQNKFRLNRIPRSEQQT